MPIDQSTPAFPIPGECADDTPFERMHVWQWALMQPRAKVGMREYLQSLGFVIGTHRLSEGDYKRLDYAINAFHRIAPRMPARPFAELFSPATHAPGAGFYVSHRPGRWVPSPELVQCLRDAGWIYDITPDSTYFEVIGGNRLFAKYQQIIGSRFLCVVTE